MFNLFKKSSPDSETLKMLFEETFQEIKKTSKTTQFEVAKKIISDLASFLDQSGKINPKLVPILHEHYKKMRQDAVNEGAKSDRDPKYAYPALMESLFMTFPHDPELANQMFFQIASWCRNLGIGSEEG